MKNPKNKKKKGFTLVELVVTVAIIVILSMISVPIYNDHVFKSKLAEGYLLLAQIRDMQIQYYNEYQNFFPVSGSGGTRQNYNNVLAVDARINKYFTSFLGGIGKGDWWRDLDHYFLAIVDSRDYGHLTMHYDVDTGSTIIYNK